MKIFFKNSQRESCIKNKGERKCSQMKTKRVCWQEPRCKRVGQRPYFLGHFYSSYENWPLQGHCTRKNLGTQEERGKEMVDIWAEGITVDRQLVLGGLFKSALG